MARGVRPAQALATPFSSRHVHCHFVDGLLLSCNPVQGLIDFLSQYPALALGVVFAPALLESVAVIGAILGDGFSYWLGHRYQEALRTWRPLL